jgi:hypothetical protein
MVYNGIKLGRNGSSFTLRRKLAKQVDCCEDKP